MAGQSVSVVAFTAILSSLFVTTVARRIDRRWLLMFFSAVLAISCALVALAPTFDIVLVGRVLLGLVWP
jgi:predicted MFS family arabinose efflux permease